MNTVKIALDKRGLSPLEASKSGIPYQSVYKQYKGERKPSGEYALLYERLLEIPRWEIRPDLWPKPTTSYVIDTPSQPTEEA